MRELQTQDMYILSQIADKLDFQFPKIPDTSKMSEEEKKKNSTEFGEKIITFFVRNIYKAKDEINMLIANVTGKSIDEVKSMPFQEFTTTIKELVKQPGVLDFFK